MIMAVNIHSSALYDELLVEDAAPAFSRPTLRGPSRSKRHFHCPLAAL